MSFVYTGPMPRTYWQGHSDATLIEARDEYRNHDDEPFLLSLADDIDDELVRREAYRKVAGMEVAR